MKYYLKQRPTGLDTTEWATIKIYNSLANAYTDLQTLQEENVEPTCEILVFDENNEQIDFETAIETARCRAYEDLISNDYAYEQWLNQNYSAAQIMDLIRRNLKTVDVLYQIDEDWLDICREEVADMSVQDLLGQYGD